MRYVIKPIFYLLWLSIVSVKNVILFCLLWLWYMDQEAVKKVFKSRIQLLFTHGKTMKYGSYYITYVTFGYASIGDYMRGIVSYYYDMPGSQPHLGRVGDLHWEHCRFTEPRD